jgi:hypothetical protein
MVISEEQIVLEMESIFNLKFHSRLEDYIRIIANQH